MGTGSSAYPKYYRLMEHIRAGIAQGVWKPGDAIPSERELSERFGISRMTVRQAIHRLVQEGLLRREHGRGTFVATPKLRQHLTRLTGFTEDMRQRGLRSRSQVLRLEMVEPSPDAATALRIRPWQSVLLLERLRLAGEEPIALESCYLHFPGNTRLLARDFTASSLYRTLVEEFEVIPSRAEQQVEAVLATARERKLLHLPPNSPVLRNRRVTYDQHDRPFEYTESAYRGDRYVFYVELTTR